MLCYAKFSQRYGNIVLATTTANSFEWLRFFRTIKTCFVMSYIFFFFSDMGHNISYISKNRPKTHQSAILGFYDNFKTKFKPRVNCKVASKFFMLARKFQQRETWYECRYATMLFSATMLWLYVFVLLPSTNGIHSSAQTECSRNGSSVQCNNNVL